MQKCFWSIYYYHSDNKAADNLIKAAFSEIKINQYACLRKKTIILSHIPHSTRDLSKHLNNYLVALLCPLLVRDFSMKKKFIFAKININFVTLCQALYMLESYQRRLYYLYELEM